MGYAFMVGTCVGCGRIFSFNPLRVPSVRINGVKEPVCRDCAGWINRAREATGLKPFEIPADAYEPVEEYEL